MDLSALAGASVVGRLSGGHRTEVVELRRDGERLVARRTRRSATSLDWELDLMDHLSANGFTVPTTVPADDGRRQVAGVVVQRWLPGRPPGSYDWPAVAKELRRLHEVTAGWPQRPDFLGTKELLHADVGADVDLTAMPADAVTACRAAWRALSNERAVVHGDPGGDNVRVDGDRIGLLDWDEARVDHPDLDLADMAVPFLSGARNRTARAAIDAWEAACSWQLEPSYARSRLAELMRPRPPG